MKFWSQFLVLAVLVVQPVAGAQDPAEISLTREEMETDLNQLSAAFEEAHAGLTRHAPRSVFDQAVSQAIASLPNNATELEFLRIVGHVTATVADGHTNTRLSQRALRWALDEGRFLPIEPLIYDGRLFVRTSYADISLTKGAEIISINGRSAQEIIGAASSVKGVDGFAEPPRYRQLEDNFWYRYYSWVDESPTFELVVRDVGDLGSRTIRLDGLPYSQIREVRLENRREALLFEILPGEQTAILTIGHFLDPATPEFLEASFASIATSPVENLIIDLRRNSGGYDEYNIDLFSYLSDRPYRFYSGWTHTSPNSENLFGVEIDTDDFFIEMRTPPSETEKARLVAELSLSELLDYAISTFSTRGVHQPHSSLVFEGDVYILMDGASGSSGGEIPALAHHLGLATLIGEPPNAAYEGTTAGVSALLTLEASGLRIGIPMLAYYNAVLPGVFEHTSVSPDFHVVQTPSDTALGRDTVMEFTQSLIEMRTRPDGGEADLQ